MTEFIPKELTQEEIKILRDMVEREKAVTKVWGWIKAFILIAVPISTLYAFWELHKR